MLICIFDTGGVTSLVPYDAPRLDEEAIAEHAPVVRAEVFRRLESLWTALKPHIDGSPDEDGIVRRPDPRLVDSGIRILSQLQKLYRLDSPGKAADEAGEAVPGEVLAQVCRALADLEARTVPVAGPEVAGG
jgi:hypothetical protein